MITAGAEILGAERRRKWTPAEKAQFLEEALQPGVTVASVADKHGISRGLVAPKMHPAAANQVPDKESQTILPTQEFCSPATLVNPMTCG